MQCPPPQRNGGNTSEALFVPENYKLKGRILSEKKDTLGQFLTSRQCLEQLENQNIIQNHSIHLFSMIVLDTEGPVCQRLLTWKRICKQQIHNDKMCAEIAAKSLFILNLFLRGFIWISCQLLRLLWRPSAKI